MGYQREKTLFFVCSSLLIHEKLVKRIHSHLKVFLNMISSNEQTSEEICDTEHPFKVQTCSQYEIDSNDPSKMSPQVHLAHNYVRWIRGPAKIVMNHMSNVIDTYTETKYIDLTIRQVIQQELDKQANYHHRLKSPFIEITSDWFVEGENANPGFISTSIWMRDPQNRRILVKTHGHPLCAVNEWLAYVLGEQLELPVNEVQIGIYRNHLVTLHTDIAQANEKTISFMDLPKQMRQRLLTHPILYSMDLFDHIIQNVDRTPGNILLTIRNTDNINDPTTTLKIHFIDHSFSFGVGKHDVISAIACKLHSKHLSVGKFDSVDQATKFTRYINKLHPEEHVSIRKTLNQFAKITDETFQSWMAQIQGLLSTNQYSRILDVLCRQRDIAINL